MNFNTKVLLSPGKAMYIDGKFKVRPKTGCEGQWGGRGVRGLALLFL